MISLTLLAVIIGLIASLATFGMALWSLRKGVVLFEPLAKGIRWLAVSTMILVVCLAGAMAYTYSESQTNHSSLCSFKGDLQTRVVEGESYLKGHPQGVAGVPASTIKESLDNEKRTIESLSDLNC